MPALALLLGFLLPVRALPLVERARPLAARGAGVGVAVAAPSAQVVVAHELFAHVALPPMQDRGTPTLVAPVLSGVRQ